MKTTFLTTILVFAGFALSAQTAPSWLRLSAPSNYQNFNVKEVATAVDGSGNVYTAASIFDSVNNQEQTMLVKYNASGVQQWIRTQIDPVNYAVSGAVTLLTDNAGNSYIVGYGHHNQTTGRDISLMKYDNAGNRQWIRYWDGGNGDNDYPTSAALDAAGNIVVGGYANVNSSSDLVVVKWSADGTQLWAYTWNNPAGNDEDRALAVTSDAANNTFVTGSTYQSGTYRDMLTMKLDNTGAAKWIKIYGHTGDHDDDFGLDIITDAAGNCYATGGAGAIVTLKYDTNGGLLWTNRYNTYVTNNGNLKKILMDKDNNLIVAGDAFVSTSHQTDLIISKISSTTGTTIWSNSYDLISSNAIESSDHLRGAALDASGNIYITESYDGPDGEDMALLLYSNGGGEKWRTTYSNAADPAGVDRGYSMVLDKDRSVIIGGISQVAYGSQGDIAVMTMKYNAANIPTAVRPAGLASDAFTMYPNPARNLLYVALKDASPAGSRLTLSDMAGRMVMRRMLSAGTTQLDLSPMGKGTYLLEVNSGAGSLSRQLVIE